MVLENSDIEKLNGYFAKTETLRAGIFVAWQD